MIKKISTHDLTKRSTVKPTNIDEELDISTHDLTKRSTRPRNWQWVCQYISTHDLTKRSTTRYCDDSCRNITFQLTTSRRGRRYWIDIIIYDLIISTHDLTKRSTILDWYHHIRSYYFNSRPHEEVDDTGLISSYTILLFQLTTSRRGRLVWGYQKNTEFLFQLTTSRRGRRSVHSLSTHRKSFQLTTSRRGRR